MESVNVQAIELAFLLLLLFVVAFGALANRLQIPYAIVLVIAGALLAFVPGIPRISLNPDVIFYVILPPLLYSAAWVTSWREFRLNLPNILMLAIGLVFFTVYGISETAGAIFPGFDWKTGLVLGAIVAPTDAIAATSIGKRIGLPKRLMSVLEGESLVNDATGLLALEFGIAVVARGHSFTVTEGFWRLTYLIIGGLAIGLLTAWIVDHLERRVDNGPIEIALSILVPYAAYFGADKVRASGVLAVVACGLYLSRRSSAFFSPGVRLQVWAVWESLTFILNGLVFVLIGLQLPSVLAEIQGYRLPTLITYGLLFSALVIVLRLMWLAPAAHIAYSFRRRFLKHTLPRPTWRTVVVMGWTGMRGVIALAAAIALPQTLEDGTPFPQRGLIVFLAFSVIFVTLVLQGLTLPYLVRLLGLAESDHRDPEEESARRTIVEAALAYLKQAHDEDGESIDDAVYEDLIGHYQQRLSAHAVAESEDGVDTEHHRRLLSLFRNLLAVERQTAVRLRNQGQISDDTLRELEHELDLREAGPPHAV